ncbi:hypothetical protein SAMN00017405_0657 [Desulfonispora thiosulfatigenes DSM 11270]|uniref:Putative pyruvate, phosphate dikinase regulatory protein n=1 Tax=Desulfonispora thiosulfatigenes DSM 11270 TaxID=656914 RepID=A0A1W1V8E1_DESTI|nr:pyruvate, water dikinase regulatory protein [Desulfonispora thiosulfatigenes]SMB89747.1 hypothetical protein SAMN00017405_0657 [Desulfonispora thiosulfatigenes DSM 11270]
MIINNTIVYVISDSLGETAEFVARAAVSQFKCGTTEFRRIPYVTTEDHLLEIIEEVSRFPNTIIAYTLVVESLKKLLEQESAKRNIATVDVLGPMMKVISEVTGHQPHGEPGLVHKMDDDYFRKIEAIEFAVKYDDGKDPRGIMHADIVLIGVSRTSKTPLCMYLAHKRIKATNIPLVPEVSPPEELFKLPHGKIIGLKIRPNMLNEIRTERLKTMGLMSSADYASIERILNELDYAEELMKKLGCPVLDVSNRAIEETASKILKIMYRGDQFEK